MSRFTTFCDIILGPRASRLKLAEAFGLRISWAMVSHLRAKIQLSKWNGFRDISKCHVSRHFVASRSVLALRAQNWPRPTASVHIEPKFELSACQNSALQVVRLRDISKCHIFYKTFVMDSHTQTHKN